MARWRPEQPEPEESGDAQTIRALTLYQLRTADPPVPGVVAGMSVEDARRVCGAHPDHPAAVRALSYFDAEEAS